MAKTEISQFHMNKCARVYNWILLSKSYRFICMVIGKQLNRTFLMILNSKMFLK